MSLIDRPLVHPDRKVVGFRPVKALRHFGKLAADKEDTAQVFHIIDALKGKKSLRQLEAENYEGLIVEGVGEKAAA